MNQSEEIWKHVVGNESYMISSMGRVKSLERNYTDSVGRKYNIPEKIMKTKVSKSTGYPQVNLWVNGKSRPFCIHRLIAEAFIPNPNNYPCVNHIDEDRSNSVLGNLEWCTYKYNCTYGSAREKRRESLIRFYKNNPELKTKIKKRGATFKVNQYSLDGKLIKTYEGGIPEINEILGKSSSISSCVLHKNKTAYGFVWRYEGDPFEYPTKKERKKIDYENSKPLKHQKYVIQLDKCGNEIRRFRSVSEVGRYFNIDRHILSRKKTAGGYVFVKELIFKVEQKVNEYIPKGHNGPRPDLKGRFAKKVIQESIEGEYINTFASVRLAASSLGKIQGSHISACCRGILNSAYGYKWRYV